MFDQTFVASDVWTIGFLIVLEALLSADNALVLALMVRHLPRVDQKKALLYGLGGAFALRTIAILLAAFIIKFWWLQAIGALYLLYLPLKHFRTAMQGDVLKAPKVMGFWMTVLMLNLVDTAFALDSVLAAVAVVDTVQHPDKLWVVVAGAVIGIIVLRFAAAYFIRLLEKYPVLDHVAYLLVGWAGIKLLLISGHSFGDWYLIEQGTVLPFAIPHMPGWLFWGGMFTIAIGGGWWAFKHPKPPSERDDPGESIEEQAEGFEEIMGFQIKDDDDSDVPDGRRKEDDESKD